jgi:hypothetical protein
MREDMAAYIKSCPICQGMKAKPQCAPVMRPLAARPFEFITLDWLGGFPLNRRGHYSVLNIVCKYCKWVLCIRCDEAMRSEDLCKLLYDKVNSKLSRRDRSWFTSAPWRLQAERQKVGQEPEQQTGYKESYCMTRYSRGLDCR